MIPNVAFALAVVRMAVRTAASFARARVTLLRARLRLSPLAFASYLLHNRSDTARTHALCRPPFMAA